ncbi:MAG: efflux RND transporter periplasmic adaptor subunit, partial [Synechococcaceae cyanobacterium]|nr:efflux RND transporter periplasmic adaptor subunit [Synechococcaceae cyanobacterium]
IVADGPLWTNMDVPATVAGRVRLGQTVLLSGQGGSSGQARGRVVFISPYFQSGSIVGSGSANTVLVKAEFPNPGGRLKPGLKVRNRIITDRETQLAVPVQAVMMQASQPFVYRLQPLSTVAAQLRTSATLPRVEKERILALPPTTPIALQTPVQLGRLQGNLYPLRGGLRSGDRVVVSNTALLRSGIPVKVDASAADGR